MTSSPSSELTGAASAAPGLARHGWPVFPCAPRGKRPLTRNGLHDATTDVGLVAGWWQQWPDANIGVRTGNGLIVLDVDGDVGAESLRDLEHQHGDLPPTVSVITGGGGTHYYLRTSEPVRNSASKVAPGIDIRGDGGYVIAAGSVHLSGRRYEWERDPEEAPVAPLPAWLLGRLREPACGARKRTPAGAWVKLIQAIPEGQRNDSLARVMGHLLARGVDEHVALELLRAVNDARCRPPLPDREVIAVAESILRRHLRQVAS